MSRIHIARDRYDRSYPDLLVEFLGLSWQQGYTPREIFSCELLNREPMEEKRRSAISKSKLIELQQRLNPPEAAPLVENKALFYVHCQDEGLPIPRLLGLWEREGGRTADGSPLRGEEEWAAFFASLTAREIVIKPSLGVYGRGIRFLQRSGNGWRDQDGPPLSVPEILRDLRQDAQFDSFVIQERVVPHPRLVALSGTGYLQTLRIITGVNDAGDAQVLCGEMLLICGSATTSNFASGASGNAVSDVDLQSGELVAVLVARADGVGMDRIDRHPVTGEAFAEFVIPYWQEACKLCQRAALASLPLRTVGWDVGITDEGPVLIEGNAWWDPHSYARSMGPFLSYAQTLLGTSDALTGTELIHSSATQRS